MRPGGQVNFNHERFVISCGTARAARLCFEEAFKCARSLGSYVRVVSRIFCW